MKVTQYITTTGAEMQSNPVFPSTHLSGATDIVRGKAIGNDFLGFGVAITGSSCYNLYNMDKSERRAVLENLYGKGGLNFRVGRISVASSDYSPELYSYDDVEGDLELKHFSVSRDKAYIIPVLQEIVKINPDVYLFASPWSPPYWMKTGGSIGGGYMRREFVDCYAEYIVKFIKEYAKCGIKISAITPQNEAETAQSGTMPACIWHPDIEAEFIIKLREKLDENGLDVKIWMYDHNFSGVNRVKWSLENHEKLLESIGGVAFHYYDGTIEQTGVLKKDYPDLKLHFTEGGPRLYDTYADDWCKWGIMSSKVLNSGYKSFTGWNLMLDQLGGPNVGPFFCGGLITRNNQTGELSYSGQYKAFSHLSRLVKANAEIYEMNLPSNDLIMSNFPEKCAIALQASCVKNPDGTICYFIVNANDKKAQVQICENGQWYYVEVMPNTLTTVVFEE